ncbi:MAG TPA: PQQ-binding-like beta-propeller repeat protein [Ktedonobacterales bacterium]
MQPASPSYLYCPGCGYISSATSRFCSKCGTSLAGAAPAELPTPSLSAAAQDAFTLGSGRYTDITMLSDEGGMGFIFRARDTKRGDQLCVIKQLRPDPDLDEAMFQREAALLATLRHPNLPACWDAFSEGGQHYLVSELILGLSLQHLIEKRGVASEDEVIRWGIDLCDALVYIHSQPTPIVHRDIKPDNVIITPEGQAVLVDFGIARPYQVGRRDTMRMGTWGYLPPEQKAGQTEPRSDLYALGGTLHFALTGNDPQLLNLVDINLQWHKGVSFPEVRSLNPRVSAEMEAILLRATRVVIEERYPSARAMLDDLRNLELTQQSRHRTTPAQTTTPIYLPLQWPTFRGSAARSGVSTATLRPVLTTVWTFPTKDAIDGSPILSDGIIYVGSRDQHLYALDARAKNELWSYKADGPVRSTPTLHGDTLFFGDDDGTFHAVQSAGGQGRWRAPLYGKCFASAAAGGGLIIVATQSGRVVALAPTSGQIVWEHQDSTAFYASPAIQGNLALLVNGSGLVKGLELATGKLLWTFQASGPVRATPASDDGLLLVAALDGSLTLLDARTGERLWQRSLGPAISASPVLTGDTVFAAGQDGALFALSRDNANRLWNIRTSGQLAASPVLCDASLLVIDTEGNLSLIDAERGTIRYREALGASVFASPAVSGHWCVIGTRQGNLMLLEGQP